MESGTLVLRAGSGFRREVPIAEMSSVQVDGLAREPYVVNVIAPGFEHREQQLDLTSPEKSGARPGPNGDLLWTERLILWPKDWVAVVCQTPEGKPFRELADVFEMEPKRLFVDAFEVRTRVDPPVQDVWEAEDPQPATFRKPPGYQSWDLPGGVIGSLQFLRLPPMWVGLRLYHKLVGWELLAPGAREVVFRLDESIFEERFASLMMQVVDATTGQGVTDARVTLLADTSALRRREHQKVATENDGHVKLIRIVPSRYELTITRGDSLHQEFVDLGPTERRDLGKIPIGLGRPFEVRVLDEQGQPVTAWLEIGTYRSGARSKDLYPPMISRSTDSNGEAHLPTPSAPSIVRATMVTPSDRTPTDVCSVNTLVDPQHLPASGLALVVCHPIRVFMEVSDPQVASVEFKDALDLVVSASQPPGVPAGHPQTHPWPEASLIPGAYRAAYLRRDGSIVDERPFEVKGTAVHLVFP